MTSYLYKFGPIIDSTSNNIPEPAPILPQVSISILNSFPKTVIIDDISYPVIPTISVNGWIHAIIPTLDGNFEYSNRNISVNIPDIDST